MDVDEQLKCVEEFFNFTLTKIPDFDQKDLDRPLNCVKIRKDILIRYNNLKGILDEDLWQTFSKRSIYILQALENLVANADDADYEESSDEGGSSEDENDREDVMGDIYNETSDNISKTDDADVVSSDIDDDNNSDSDNSGNDSDLDDNDNSESDNNKNHLAVKTGFNVFNDNIKFNKSERSSSLVNSNVNNGHKSKTNKTQTESREQLKRKLQEKISEQRAKRKKFDEEHGKTKNKKKKKEKQSIPDKSLTSTTIPTTVNPAQPVIKFNQDNTIIYSKIEFPSDVKKRGKFKGLPRGSNYGQLLEMAEKEKKKIKDLKSLDKTKADNYKDKLLWRKVLAKAEGVKIKDNENMLRRSINRKNCKKSKGKERWKEREDNLKKKQHEKQVARKKNIHKRAEQKKTKKIKKRQKK